MIVLVIVATLGASQQIEMWIPPANAAPSHGPLAAATTLLSAIRESLMLSGPKLSIRQPPRP